MATKSKTAAKKTAARKPVATHKLAPAKTKVPQKKIEDDGLAANFAHPCFVGRANRGAATKRSTRANSGTNRWSSCRARGLSRSGSSRAKRHSYQAADHCEATCGRTWLETTSAH